MQELHELERRMDYISFFKNQRDVWVIPTYIQSPTSLRSVSSGGLETRDERRILSSGPSLLEGYSAACKDGMRGEEMV